mmetsp:Transcript_7531/g.29736  ORF Transcript_7531/g.29736 Transcript_7531/m.29736 type:complete len:220 (+) Transcript_7531:838-1497(+)
MTRSARCRRSFIFLLAILSRSTPGPLFLPMSDTSPPGRLRKPSSVTASGSSASSPSGASKRASRPEARGALRKPKGVTSVFASVTLTVFAFLVSPFAGFVGFGSSTNPRAFFFSSRTLLLGPGDAAEDSDLDFFESPTCATSADGSSADGSTSSVSVCSSGFFWRVSNSSASSAGIAMNPRSVTSSTQSRTYAGWLASSWAEISATPSRRICTRERCRL